MVRSLAYRTFQLSGALAVRRGGQELRAGVGAARKLAGVPGDADVVLLRVGRRLQRDVAQAIDLKIQNI